MQVVCIYSTPGPVIVPVNVVAHIVNLDSAERLDAPSDYARYAVSWQGYRAPVMNSARLMAGVDDDWNSVARAVILWSVDEAEPTRLFALTSLRSPDVVEIDEDDDSAAAYQVESGGLPETLDGRFILGCMKINDGIAFIPDLAAISKQLPGLPS